MPCHPATTPEEASVASPGKAANKKPSKPTPVSKDLMQYMADQSEQHRQLLLDIEEKR